MEPDWGMPVTVSTPDEKYTEIIHVNRTDTFGEIKREACRQWGIDADGVYLREHTGHGIRDDYNYIEGLCDTTFVLESLKPENRDNVRWTSPYHYNNSVDNGAEITRPKQQHISYFIVYIIVIAHLMLIGGIWHTF